MHQCECRLPKGCPSEAAIKEFQEMFEAETGILLDPEQAREEATAFLTFVHIVLGAENRPAEAISRD